VLPRAGRRDLVALTSSEIGDGALTIYDDESGSVAAVLATDAGGERLFGEQPSALVAEPLEGPRPGHRLYVASFDRGFVRTVRVYHDAPTAPELERKFGREVPEP
jgi:hypothetical protein